MRKSLLFTLAFLAVFCGCNPKTQPAPEQDEPIRHRYILALDASTGKEVYRTKYGQSFGVGFFQKLGHIRDGKLYIGTSDNDENVYVSAVEVSSGKELWSTRVDPEDVKDPLRQTLFLAKRGLTGRLDPDTGKLAEKPRDLPATPLASSDGLIYCATTSEVIAFDSKEWEEKWTSKLPGTQDAIIAKDGTVVFQYPNGFQAFSPAGEPAWELKTSFAPSAMATKDSTVYLATAEPKLVAVEATTGETLWEKSWKGQDGSWDDVLLSENLIVMAVGESLLAMDRETGEEKWKAPRGGVSLNEEIGAVFCYTMSTDEVVRYNLNDGKEEARWKLDLNSTSQIVSDNLLLLETVDKPAEDQPK